MRARFLDGGDHAEISLRRGHRGGDGHESGSVGDGADGAVGDRAVAAGLATPAGSPAETRAAALARAWRSNGMLTATATASIRTSGVRAAAPRASNGSAARPSRPR